MSRKSQRNPPPASTTPPPVPEAGRSPPGNRRVFFIVAAVGLLLAFVVATLIYKSEQASSAQRAAASNLPALASEQAPRFGDPAAKVHIVEFLDPACETCAHFYPEVKKLMAAHPARIRLSIRHVPFHTGSDLVVRILEATRKQDKYAQTLEALFGRQRWWVVNHQVQATQVWQSLGGLGLDLDRLRTDMDSPEIAQRMAQDMRDAQTLGVRKTPEFFVNGRPLPSFGLEELQTLVDDELRRAYR
jgi:protein-disulfide isomerase